MVTVLRAEGLRVVIYTNDHVPAQVHVLGDGAAKIDLAGPQGAPVLVWADGMTRGEVRRAVRLVTEQQAFLRQRWEDIHG
jgi:murein DD-endopeptidase MepM/ murein hydrolase activator NlpD